jgi:hypothetical protein
MLLIRPCLACGQEDDHPRDQRVLPDGSVVFWHQDCHADAGCLDCKWLVEHKGKLRGAKWREQVQAVHDALPAEELDKRPHERKVVAALKGGRLATNASKEN